MSNNYNRLIFGKDATERIINITYDDGLLYTYTQSGDTKVNCHIKEYRAYALTRDECDGSEILKGNRFYKYATPIYDTDYEDVYGHGLYKPRTPEEGYMLRSGATYYKGMRLNELSLLSFDIEATSLKVDHPDAQVVIISNTFRDRKGILHKKLFDVTQYGYNDTEMIASWVKWVNEQDPDIVLGHNIFGYDLPYLYSRSGETLGLGRDSGSNIKFNKRTSSFRKDGQQSYDYNNASINGREIVDTMFLSIKYDAASRSFPSYGLKKIEQHLKLVDDSRIEWDFDKFPVLDVLEAYRKGNHLIWQTFCQYAKDDADSPVKMFDIMAPSLFYLNQSIPKKFQQMVNEATGGQIDSFMIRAYLQDDWSQPMSTRSENFQGAISFGLPGFYTNVYSVDFASLYPSIIMAYEIYDKDKDPLGYFLKAIKYFTEERFKNKALFKETKDKYYDDLQISTKQFINSGYGFMGAGYLLYNSPNNASKITEIGRQLLDKICFISTGKSVYEWKDKLNV